VFNFHDPGLMKPKEFYSDYEMPLARAFYNINQRGVLVDQDRLSKLRDFIDGELIVSCGKIASSLKGISVIPSLPLLPNGRKSKQPSSTLNLSSPDQIIAVLKDLGLQPPKIRRASGDYTESSNEEALNEMFAESGNPVLKEILRVRELNKMLGTYVGATLWNNVLYGAFFVTGTVTDRRSCRENFLGLGTNLQNQPKHSDLGKRYRECLVSRPGKIFVECDQASAEDWVIQGLIADLTGNKFGLEDLAKGGRHEKLACFIFGLPIDKIRYDVERYMAKKVRYAGSYDMEAFRFSKVMAQEGFVVPQSHCDWLLTQFHAFEPAIRQVFQNYVKTELINNRTLTNPFGYTRQFMGLRDYADNKKIFKEGYAQLPQSTVGNNTGMSILWLEANYSGHVVMDGHDAVYLEIDDAIEDVVQAIRKLSESFDRIIRFPNGLEITIPIEFEIGYDLEHVSKCGDLTLAGLTRTYNSLNRPQNLQSTSIIGQPPPSLEQRSSVTSG
jgi:hypothetical protein